MTKKALVKELLEKLDDVPVTVREEPMPVETGTEEEKALRKSARKRLLKEMSAVQSGKSNLSTLRRLLNKFEPANSADEIMVEGFTEALEWRVRAQNEGREYPTLK